MEDHGASQAVTDLGQCFFSTASSSGTRLHRGYVEEATLEDKPPQTSHIVFVVHGIGQKMDQGRIIKNTAM